MEKTTKRSRAKSSLKRNHVPGSNSPRSTNDLKKRPGRSNQSNFIIQGSILAAAGIIVRLIGMLYRIPLAEKIGDEGIGYYSSAFSVYSILLIMSSYSLPIAVSKMVASRLAKKQYQNCLRILKASLFYATIVGGVGAAALWFGADAFADAMKMPYSAYALRTLAPTIWVMAYLGVLRGYFQGNSTMVPTAVSQVFEQIVNALISIVAAGTLFDYGVKSNLVYEATEYSFAFGAAGGTIGTGAGAFAALAFLLVLMAGYRPVMRRQRRRDRTLRTESYGHISRVLCITIIPIVISSVIYNISSVVDNYIFGNAMTTMGRGGEIASSWGVYMGKYHLLFNIPVAMANALASSLIPSLSKAAAERDRRQMKNRVGSAIRFSMIIAIPSAVGLTVLSAPIANLLFSSGDNAMLIQMTMVGSVAVVLFSLSTVTNAVLQGMNRMRVPIRNAAISLFAHVLILLGMMYVFKMGIYSVLYANIIFALLVCILNGLAIKRYLRYRQEIMKTFILPLVASCIMGAAVYGCYQLVSFLLGDGLSVKKENLLCTLLAIFFGAMVYFVLLIKFRCLDEPALRRMPGGKRVIRLAGKLHLM